MRVRDKIARAIDPVAFHDRTNMPERKATAEAQAADIIDLIGRPIETMTCALRDGMDAVAAVMKAYEASDDKAERAALAALETWAHEAKAAVGDEE